METIQENEIDDDSSQQSEESEEQKSSSSQSSDSSRFGLDRPVEFSDNEVMSQKSKTVGYQLPHDDEQEPHHESEMAQN